MLRTQNIININDFSRNSLVASFMEEINERLERPDDSDNLYTDFQNALQREDLINGMALGIRMVLPLLPLAAVSSFRCLFLSFTKQPMYDEYVDQIGFSDDVLKKYTCEIIGNIMRTPIQIRGSSVIIDLDSLLKWLMQKESLITKLRKEDGIIKFDFNHPYTNTTAHFPDDIILQVDLKAEIDLFVKTVAEEISKTRISQRGQRLHFFRNPLTEDQKNKIKNITLAKVEKPKKEMNSSARP